MERIKSEKARVLRKDSTYCFGLGCELAGKCDRFIKEEDITDDTWMISACPEDRPYYIERKNDNE